MDRDTLKSHWKTDFRNLAALPDIKVVRTSFYVNIAAFALLAASVAYLAYGEMDIGDKAAELSRIEAEIQKLKPANAEALKKDATYASLKATIVEIDGFLKNQPVDALAFISALGASLPPEVLIESIEQKNQTARISGYIKGPPEVATGIASTFEQNLNKNPAITKIYKNAAISNVVKDGQNEKLNFEISFSTSEQGAKKK